MSCPPSHRADGRYGHVAALAQAAVKGAEAAGAEVREFQFQETLPADLVKKIGGGLSIEPKNPTITPEALVELDGFLIGAPTRFGRLPAQVSAFLDSTGAQYAAGSLVGKFAGTFTSSNTQHGGQETTHLNIMPYFAHQGIVFVPNGYTHKFTADTTSVHGASPYGASTIAGSDGKLQPSEQELSVAEAQGKVSPAEHERSEWMASMGVQSLTSMSVVSLASIASIVGQEGPRRTPLTPSTSPSSSPPSSPARRPSLPPSRA